MSTALGAVDADAGRHPGVVGGIDADDESAFQTQHAPTARIAAGIAPAAGFAGLIEPAGNSVDRAAGDHGVEHVRADTAEASRRPLCDTEVSSPSPPPDTWSVSGDDIQSDDAGLVRGFCHRSLNLCWGGRYRRRIRRG